MTTRKKNNRRRYIIIGLVAVIAMIILWSVKGGKKDDEGTKVVVEKVTKRTITETVSAAGRIFPEIEVKIASDVSGEVVALYVEEGDSVTQGQLLCKVKPDIYQSALERSVASQNSSKAQLASAKSTINQVEAQIVQMQAQVDNAEIIHNRNKQLLAEGAIAQSDVDNSLANLRTAKANLQSSQASLEGAKQSAEAASFQLKSAEATVKEAKTNLNQTSIYAPMSGIVSKLNIEQGERVVGTLQMAGTEILRIANMKYIEVQVDVSENEVLRVSVGDEAEIEVDAYLDKKFKGIVKEIANTAQESATGGFSSDQVTNFTVKVRIDPGSYQSLISARSKYPFRPGMSATVDIKTKTKENVLTLPVPAVTSREDDKDGKKGQLDNVRTVVFQYQGDSVVLKEVSVGIQDDEFIEITEGLKEKDEIVVAPYQAVASELKQGNKVKKVTETELYGKDKKKE
jgi:HlyD family secretion protein